MSGFILVPISIGELYDKISILEIKSERMTDVAKLANVQFELKTLFDLARALPQDPSPELRRHYSHLKEVNAAIWDGEDSLRRLEREGVFGEDFVSVARKIHFDNDRRAAIKREMNVAFGSAIIEEKSHADRPAP